MCSSDLGAICAQSWPVKPVRFIVPTGPGLATDIVARLLAKAQPGKHSFGRDASSQVASIVGQLLNKRAGIDVFEIPYKTTSVQVGDKVLGDHLESFGGKIRPMG